MCALSAFVGPIRLNSSSERKFFMTQMIPWAIRCGTKCHDLMTVLYEDHFADDIDSFRQFLNFEPAPNYNPKISVLPS